MSIEEGFGEGGGGWGGVCEGNQVLTIVYFSNIECSTQEIKVSISMWRRNKNTYVWMIVNWLAILPVRVRPGIDVNFIWSHMSLAFWGLLIKCLFLSSFFLLWTSWNISYFYIFLVWTLPKLAQGAEPIGMPRSARRDPKEQKKQILMCKWLSNLLVWAQFIAYMFFFPIHTLKTYQKISTVFEGKLRNGKEQHIWNCNLMQDCNILF